MLNLTQIHVSSRLKKNIIYYCTKWKTIKINSEISQNSTKLHRQNFYEQTYSWRIIAIIFARRQPIPRSNSHRTERKRNDAFPKEKKTQHLLRLYSIIVHIFISIYNHCCKLSKNDHVTKEKKRERH